MADSVRIDEAELREFDEKAKRFGLWAVGLEVLGISMMFIDAPVGLFVCLVKCLVLVLWGCNLMSNAPIGGAMGDYEGVNTDEDLS